MVTQNDINKRVKVEDPENRSTWFGILVNIEDELGVVKDSYKQVYKIETKNIYVLDY